MTVYRFYITYSIHKDSNNLIVVYTIIIMQNETEELMKYILKKVVRTFLLYYSFALSFRDIKVLSTTRIIPIYLYE